MLGGGEGRGAYNALLPLANFFDSIKTKVDIDAKLTVLFSINFAPANKISAKSVENVRKWRFGDAMFRHFGSKSVKC